MHRDAQGTSRSDEFWEPINGTWPFELNARNSTTLRCLSLKAFLPPFKRPRSKLKARNVDSQEGTGTEERSEVEAAVTWLKESWEGFNATYSHLSEPGDA